MNISETKIEVDRRRQTLEFCRQEELDDSIFVFIQLLYTFLVPQHFDEHVIVGAFHFKYKFVKSIQQNVDKKSFYNINKKNSQHF